MPKLQDLQPEIDSGKTVKLFLSKDDPGNGEKEDLIVRVRLDATGHYIWTRHFTVKQNPIKTHGDPYESWSDLIQAIRGVQTESDRWDIEQ